MQERIINPSKGEKNKRERERERVNNFCCRKNMDWTNNLYGLKNMNLHGLTSLWWNLITFDGPPTNATLYCVDDV